MHYDICISDGKGELIQEVEHIMLTIIQELHLGKDRRLNLFRTTISGELIKRGMFPVKESNTNKDTCHW